MFWGYHSFICKTVIILSVLFIPIINYSQCVNSFPYVENFESGQGGWASFGNSNDWAYGTPNKTHITTAASGTKCWVTGGLNGTGYNNGEQSYVKSPCFDFTTLLYPYIEFKIYWESERKYDGANLQYSLNNGSTWITVGSFFDPMDCMTQHWYNDSVKYLNSPAWISDNYGWAGRAGATTNSGCQGGFGSLGWVTAKHCLSFLAGQSNVMFRVTFGAGTTCNNFDGVAFDDIKIDNAPPNQPTISYVCNTNGVSFTGNSNNCPNGWNWDFGDGTANSTIQNPTHNYATSGNYTIKLTANGPCNPVGHKDTTITILKCEIASQYDVHCGSTNNGSATASVTGGNTNYTFLWNTNPPQTSATASNLAAGTYIVTISNSQACVKSASVTITTSNNLFDTIAGFSDYCTDNNNATLYAPLGFSGYQWYKADTTIIIGAITDSLLVTNPLPTDYYFVVYTDNGCVKRAKVLMQSNSNSAGAKINPPNVFTPNGDGKNDMFALTIPSVKTFDIEIYNRWGNKVFSSNDINNAWDGKQNNNSLSDGVYFWILKYSTNCGSGDIKQLAGAVQVIR